MKRAYAVYIVLGVCSFLCGCETVGAFSTRRMTVADVSYITHAGSLSKVTTPVNVESAEPDAGFEASSGSAGSPANPQNAFSKADAWLDDNLW